MKDNNTLAPLPEGFDTTKIVFPDVRGSGIGIQLRLPAGDYDPISRNHFKGFFAIKNTSSAGKSKESLLCRIVEDGGLCTICKVVSNSVEDRHIVRVLDAHTYLGMVVIHIEPVSK